MIMWFIYGILAALVPSAFAAGVGYLKHLTVENAAKRLLKQHQNYHSQFIEVEDGDIMEMMKMLDSSESTSRAPISLKKLPSPEDAIYDMVMAYEGPVMVHVDTHYLSYSFKKNNEKILLEKVFGNDSYKISFSFSHNLDFNNEDLKTMYYHLMDACSKWQEKEKARQHLEAVAKDAHRLDALLGNTKVAKVRRV